MKKPWEKQEGKDFKFEFCELDQENYLYMFY